MTKLLNGLTGLSAMLTAMAGVSAIGFRIIEGFSTDTFPPPFQSQELFVAFCWLAGAAIVLDIILFLVENVWWEALGRPVRTPDLSGVHPPFRPDVYTTRP